MWDFSDDIKKMIEAGENLRKKIEGRERFQKEAENRTNRAKNMPIGGIQESIFIYNCFETTGKGGNHE